MKMDAAQIPAEPAEIHFAISQTAAEVLGGWVDGNGLKADQVRLVKHDTQVHQLPGAVIAGLKPEIAKSQIKGKNPRGLVLGTVAEVQAQAGGAAADFIASSGIQNEILQAVAATPEKGFGMEPATIPLHTAKKEFSVVDICLKCSGAMFLNCTQCNATGRMPCTFCNGQGFTQCQMCFGMGRVQQQDGSQGPCLRCQHTGRIPCQTCQGNRSLMCTLCNGNGTTGCVSCGQSGFLTSMYDVTYKAEIRFDLDRQKIPPEVQKIVDAIGVKKLSTEEHAEIFCHPVEIREGYLFIPFTALFPVAAAEFSVEGKIYPATVAGLRGRIVEIEPLLDKLIKPGISAMVKLSKGPMASQALIETACKYRLIRQVISGISHRPKKTVYQKLVRDYPVVLSKKYANATVQYAGKALLSVSAGPRVRGLIIGTGFGALLAAGYYMTGVRGALLALLEQRNAGRHLMLADIAVWLGGYAVALFMTKFMAAGALKKLLPDNVKTGDRGLPSAGVQGFWALLTTFAGWFIVAAFAAAKPEWLAPVFSALRIR
jgi:hypothetical protein